MLEFLKAWYSIIVLKLPLNPKQSISVSGQLTCRLSLV